MSAQQSDGLIYNFNEPIVRLSSQLKSSKFPECYTDLLSIGNLESNYLTKVSVPKSLLDFLIAKNIAQVPTNTEELKREVFLLGRYIHSVEYDSYLLMVTEEYVDIEEDDTKYLYLVNIKSDTLISVCNLALYSSGIGSTVQTYSMYRSNDTFEKYFETITIDVELIQEEDKVRQKQGDRFKSIFIVDSTTGEVSLKK
ncbi:MAG: hypothetical protein RIF33_08400 [Cyclobacteriaceae bacterium]